jgi:NADH-quinone oxidoreductase subunit C
MSTANPAAGTSGAGDPDEQNEQDGSETGEAPAGPETAYDCPVTWSRGQRVIHVPREAWTATAEALLADGWNMCVDVTAVDYSAYRGHRSDLPAGAEPERFEVVANFLSHERRQRLRARAQVPADDPTIGSLYALYPGVDFQEREIYDLMGITFDGHPDLSRILMPETWQGHPLRKDYAIGAIPVQFKLSEGEPVPEGEPRHGEPPGVDTDAPTS